jgi:hypothetical protein
MYTAAASSINLSLVMAELLAAFPKGDHNGSPRPLEEAIRWVEAAGLGANACVVSASGAWVATTSSPAHTPSVFEAPDGSGWIAVKGIVFDVTTDEPRVDLESLWRRFTAGAPLDWNQFEGTFALAAWDGVRRRGVAVNDQTSQLNLYYCEDPGYVYVTTSALPLARALGRGLDAAAAREFLARGALTAPSAMFEGFKRLNVGERLEHSGSASRIDRHWYYPRELEPWSFERAAEEAAGFSSDRIRRYAAASGGGIIMDLTSGYDSRLLASAADHAGIQPAVTVNGDPDDEEVVISKRVADATGWPMRHFDPGEVWTRPVDADARRELTYRTDGNLPFAEAYHQWVTRPALGGEFAAHTAGVGGEFIRYHPWGQEFLGIGRRRQANVDNILKYRMLHDGPPPRGLFDGDWYSRFRRDLRARVVSVCGELPGSLTTPQLDAVHVWKQTGHPTLYLSAAFNWLPATVPLMGAGFTTVGMTTPWQYRLTARLTRRVTHMLCPRAAAVVTRYGGTAGPVGPSNLHLHLYQPIKRLGHLAGKLEMVMLRGALTKRIRRSAPVINVPYLTNEFRSFLSPGMMASRAMYSPDGLCRVLDGRAGESPARLIIRIASIEQLCRELDFSPAAGFIYE